MASTAASRAGTLLSAGKIKIEAITAAEEMRQKVTNEEVEFTMKVLSEDEKPKAAKPAKEKAEKAVAAGAVPA